MQLKNKMFLMQLPWMVVRTSLITLGSIAFAWIVGLIVLHFYTSPADLHRLLSDLQMWEFWSNYLIFFGVFLLMISLMAAIHCFRCLYFKAKMMKDREGKNELQG
jgi:hypothetical protein